MRFSASAVVAILGFAGNIFASPTTDADSSALEVRGRGDTAREAIGAALNCDGTEATCNMNCKAILCHGKSPIMKRDSAAGRRHYRDSGAGTGPFRALRIPMARRGVSRLDGNSLSAEEFPWERSAQGGNGALVSGVPLSQQNIQGNHIAQMYRDFNIANGKWFHVYYRRGNQALMPYCQALYSRPPNTRVCDNNDKTYRLKNLIYVRNSKPGKFVTFAQAAIRKIKKRDVELLADGGPEMPELATRDDENVAVIALAGADDADHDIETEVDDESDGPQLAARSIDDIEAELVEREFADDKIAKRAYSEQEDVEYWNENPRKLYTKEELGY